MNVIQYKNLFEDEEIATFKVMNKVKMTEQSHVL
jgi:hypothetical protein